MTLLYLSFAWIPDLLDSEDAKNNVGWIFNAFMGVNISVHLYFMFRNAFRDVKARCRKRKSKKAQNKKIENEMAKSIEKNKADQTVEDGPRESRRKRRKHMGQAMMSQINEVDEDAESDAEGRLDVKSQLKAERSNHRTANLSRMSLTQLVQDDESPYKIDQNEADSKNIFLAPDKKDPFPISPADSSKQPIEEKKKPSIKIKQSELLPLPNKKRRNSKLIDPNADFDLDNAFEDFVINSI